MKRTIRQKMIASMVCAILTLTATPCLAFAEEDRGIMPLDNQDRDLVLRLDWSTTWATEGQRKDTSSSVYVNVTTMGNLAYLYTEGSSNPSGAWTDYTHNGGAKLTKLGRYQIYNYIYENVRGKYGAPSCYARITAWRSTGLGTQILGKWSPDYVPDGSPVLNP